MSYFPTRYPAGTFSWADVSSTDIAATKKFLQELLGWTSEDVPTMPGMPDYTMFYLDGKSVAGGSPQQPDETKMGIPSHWNNYITVENVDETAKKATELGAKIIMPAMDVMDAGRMAGIQDPTGAVFFVWVAKKHIGANVVNKVGAMCWNELYSPDVEKSKDFYGKLFGWEFATMPETGDYISIKNKGRSNGGMMKLTPEMEMPSHWATYFTVTNADETAEKAKKLGGTVYMVKDIGPVGKIAVVADPAGAYFIAMEMKVKPDAWEE